MDWTRCFWGGLFPRAAYVSRLFPYEYPIGYNLALGRYTYIVNTHIQLSKIFPFVSLHGPLYLDKVKPCLNLEFNVMKGLVHIVVAQGIHLV
jgi:hypothetical protein